MLGACQAASLSCPGMDTSGFSLFIRPWTFGLLPLRGCGGQGRVWEALSPGGLTGAQRRRDSLLTGLPGGEATPAGCARLPQGRLPRSPGLLSSPHLLQLLLHVGLGLQQLPHLQTGQRTRRAGQSPAGLTAGVLSTQPTPSHDCSTQGPRGGGAGWPSPVPRALSTGRQRERVQGPWSQADSPRRPHRPGHRRPQAPPRSCAHVAIPVPPVTG